jgi:selenocysteine lyase/cysteine desulfurase
MPVAELTKLCRARGWWFHVDGAQTLGMFPFSLPELGPDSYAGSGHKWLGAPHETGVLYVRRERLAEVALSLVGAYSGDLPGGLPGELELNQTSLKFEYGTRNAALIVGVAAAMRFQDEVGRDRLARRNQALAARLRAGLASMADLEILTPDHPVLTSPMVTIRTPRLGYSEMFGRLWHDHGFRCRPVSEQGLNAVRISCHLFNTPSEIDGLLAAIEQVTRA